MNQKDVDEIKKELPIFGNKVVSSNGGMIIFEDGIMMEYPSSIDLIDYTIHGCVPIFISSPDYIRICLTFRCNGNYETVIIKLQNDHEVNQFIYNLTVFKRFLP